MNKDELLTKVTSMLQEYERATKEIVGCYILFETENKVPTSKGFDWQTMQYNGKKFHDKQKIEIIIKD